MGRVALALALLCLLLASTGVEAKKRHGPKQAVTQNAANVAVPAAAPLAVPASVLVRAVPVPPAPAAVVNSTLQLEKVV